MHPSAPKSQGTLCNVWKRFLTVLAYLEYNVAKVEKRW